jgi:hypothetical protein
MWSWNFMPVSILGSYQKNYVLSTHEKNTCQQFLYIKLILTKNNNSLRHTVPFSETELFSNMQLTWKGASI